MESPNPSCRFPLFLHSANSFRHIHHFILDRFSSLLCPHLFVLMCSSLPQLLSVPAPHSCSDSYFNWVSPLMSPAPPPLTKAPLSLCGNGFPHDTFPDVPPQLEIHLEGPQHFVTLSCTELFLSTPYGPTKAMGGEPLWGMNGPFHRGCLRPLENTEVHIMIQNSK